MNKAIITLVSVLSIIYSYGQRSIGIKLYQNTDVFESQFQERNPDQITSVNNVNLTRFSLAVDVSAKKGYTHEIEVFIPELSKSFDNIQFPTTYRFGKGETFVGKAQIYSLRYELNKTLTSSSKRFCFMLGVGVNPYYLHFEYIPKVNTTFYRSMKWYGFVMNVIPAMKYRLTDRFSIDLNVPVKFYDLRRQKAHVKNPVIPLRQQTRIDYNSIFFETAYTVRLGLTYTLRNADRN